MELTREEYVGGDQLLWFILDLALSPPDHCIFAIMGKVYFLNSLGMNPSSCHLEPDGAE